MHDVKLTAEAGVGKGAMSHNGNYEGDFSGLEFHISACTSRVTSQTLWVVSRRFESFLLRC